MRLPFDEQWQQLAFRILRRPVIGASHSGAETLIRDAATAGLRQNPFVTSGSDTGTTGSGGHLWTGRPIVVTLENGKWCAGRWKGVGSQPAPSRDNNVLLN